MHGGLEGNSDPWGGFEGMGTRRSLHPRGMVERVGGQTVKGCETPSGYSTMTWNWALTEHQAWPGHSCSCPARQADPGLVAPGVGV